MIEELAFMNDCNKPIYYFMRHMTIILLYGRLQLGLSFVTHKKLMS